MKTFRKIAAASLATAMLFGIAETGSANTKMAEEAITEKIRATIKAPIFNKKEDNTLVIKYRTASSLTVHQKAGTTLIKRFPELNYDIVKLNKDTDRIKAVRYYKSLDVVESVTKSVHYDTLNIAEGDPKQSNQYYLDMLQIEEAQALAGKFPVKVAVIDTGVAPSHPDLKNNLIDYYNVANPAKLPVALPHGNHVSGIIGAVKDNGIGGYGINPGARLIAIDVFQNGGTDYEIAEGILYAIKSGAKVINMSLGGEEPSPLMEDAVKKALENNVTVVAAAGNSNTDQYMYPASFEGVINVGAVDRNKRRAEFSNYGASLDLVAHGVDIYSTSYQSRKSLPTFEVLSGTSMASPIVAGTASLLLSKYPDLTPQQVGYILKQTSTDLGEKGYDFLTGYGLINPVKALQFPLDQVPKIEDTSQNNGEAQAPAKELTSNSLKIADKLKGDQPNWIKIKVKKAEYLQANLEDYQTMDAKLMLRFFPDGSQELSFSKDVNKGLAGVKEGYLFKAPIDGYLAIGVKNIHGSPAECDYTLQLERNEGVPKTEEAETAVYSLPYDSDQGAPHYFTKGEQEFDVFSYRSMEDQVVTINLDSAAGVDSIITVKDEGGNILAEINTNSTGTGENLSFSAIRNQLYKIEIGRRPENGEDLGSLIPYSVKITGKQLPPDSEDTLSWNRDSVKQTGYFQETGDNDEYSFEPAASGMYKIQLEKGGALDTSSPELAVSEWATESETWMPIGVLNDQAPIFLGLKAGKKYNFTIQNGVSQPSRKPYTIKMDLVAKDLFDPYEPNDSLRESKKIVPGQKIKGSFAVKNDQDSFYFKADRTGVIGYSIGQGKPLKGTSPDLKNSLNPVIAILEDKNGNGMADEEEKENLRIYNSRYDDWETGSFRVKKGSGYFVMALNGEEINMSSSLMPYELFISPERDDEDPKNQSDTHSVVPISLKQKSKSLLEASGYFNSIGNGTDIDWYSFSQQKDGLAQLTLTTVRDQDGVLQLFDQNGTLIREDNFYQDGDQEKMSVKLKKGTYYIAVKELYGRTGINPYQVTVVQKGVN